MSDEGGDSSDISSDSPVLPEIENRGPRPDTPENVPQVPDLSAYTPPETPESDFEVVVQKDVSPPKPAEEKCTIFGKVDILILLASILFVWHR